MIITLIFISSYLLTPITGVTCVFQLFSRLTFTLHLYRKSCGEMGHHYKVSLCWASINIQQGEKEFDVF